MDSPWIVVLAVGFVLLAGALVLLWSRGGRKTVPGVPPAEPSAAERLRLGLLATRRRLAGQLETALGRSASDVENVLPELEEALVSRLAGPGSCWSRESMGWGRRRPSESWLPGTPRRAAGCCWSRQTRSARRQSSNWRSGPNGRGPS